MYADGGVHSPYSADLAAGHDVVMVLGPLGGNPQVPGPLDAEIAALGDAIVRVITSDPESLAAIGPNPLSADTAGAALAAGATQAAREAGALKAIWHPGH